MSGYGTPTTWAPGDVVAASDLNAELRDNVNAMRPVVIEYKFDGLGADIGTGTEVDIEVPDFDISRVTLVATEYTDPISGGTFEVDLQYGTFGNPIGTAYPGTAQSICGGTPPKLDGTMEYRNTALTGWTVSMADGNFLRLNVLTCTGVQKATMAIRGNKT